MFSASRLAWTFWFSATMLSFNSLCTRVAQLGMLTMMRNTSSSTGTCDDGGQIWATVAVSRIMLFSPALLTNCLISSVEPCRICASTFNEVVKRFRTIFSCCLSTVPVLAFSCSRASRLRMTSSKSVSIACTLFSRNTGWCRSSSLASWPRYCATSMSMILWYFGLWITARIFEKGCAFLISSSPWEFRHSPARSDGRTRITLGSTGIFSMTFSTIFMYPCS
mmetsp:Transcript_24125/g.41557  ORF Transcript_24125/g.41557 Transcript_24125/m.41557 type:complete len:222 (+) Transcript_24125:1017-1682(+)